MSNIRAIAAKVLVEIVQKGSSLNELLPYHDESLTTADEALLQELCYGVCRWHFRLQYIARQLLSKPLKAKEADIQTLVLLGLYQLAYMRTPAHAAINETVNATKTLGKPWAKGLVNAVLRRFQREHEQLAERSSGSPDFNYSHPNWLLRRLQHTWPEHWQAIIEANNTKGPMTLRVNSQRISREDYLEKLAEKGIAAQPCSWSDQGITLTQPRPVTDLPEFAEGAVSVQDEAAQLAAGLIRLSPGLRILDACSAPGGKCCHMLEQEPAISDLWAVELVAARQEKLNNSLQRLSLKAHLVTADITVPDSWWDGEPFDRILLDAPCSATGVIRRHPDIKLLRRNADIDKLAGQQRLMLQRLWPLLKPGGLLLYATCSVLPEENEQVISRFLTDTPDAQEQSLNVSWGVAGTVGRYLLPTIEGPDGFYFATLSKA